MPEEALARARALLEAMAAEVPARFKYLADLANLRTGGRFRPEAVALADVLGVDWRVILAANLAYDVVVAYAYGCSTVALATADGPILARNMDWHPADALARASYLIRAEADGEPLFAHAGFPGSIGVVSGLSGRGFGVTLNAVASDRGIDLLGYPVLLHIRRVLEDAQDFDDAVQRLAHQRLCAPCLLTVVGRENHQRVIIERTPRDHALRTPHDDEPIFVTNHYRSIVEPSAPPGGHQCSRYDALRNLHQDVDSSTNISDVELLYHLTDERVIQDHTAQHVIMRPRDGAICLWVPQRLLG